MVGGSDVEDVLADLPPSAKFVYKTLEHHGRMSQKRLADETLLSSRTTRYALKQLKEAGLVESRPALHDARKTCYNIAPSRRTSTGEYANDVLVEPAWVAKRLDDLKDDASSIRLVGVIADADERSLIPGSVDLAADGDLVRPAHGGVPDRSDVEEILGARGIDSDSTVVLYGDRSNRLAAYVYWVLTYYGHPDVYLLDGGIEYWRTTEYPTTDEVASVSQREYDALGGFDQVRAYRDDVIRALTQDTHIVDVRSPPTTDEDAEGAIPGSVNVPWFEMLDESGRFRSRTSLETVFEEHDVTDDRPTVVYCSVGERSALVWFVLSELLGRRNVSNYDGSWSEWGHLVDVPKASRGENALE